jgi:TonB-dependent receptor
MLEVPLGDRIEAVVGARVEEYRLNLNSRGATLTEQSQTDVAPALNLAYTPNADIKVRGAVSRTVDRPEFRELAPFQFTEATSLRQLVGNPDLESAEITSVDLRLDWFAGLGELVSIGGFWKSLRNPIEQVFIAAASSAYSFQNAEEATIIGLELDLQMQLRRFAEALENFSVQANYSWIDSEVTVVPGGIYQPTNTKRALQGQAPYVLNVGVGYVNPAGLEAGLFMNRFGKRIEAAGGSGLPDIFEQPRNMVDATLGFPLPGRVRARIKATNLLDANYEFEQAANGIARTQRRYSTGRTYSVGLSWEF